MSRKPKAKAIQKKPAGALVRTSVLKNGKGFANHPAQEPIKRLKLSSVRWKIVGICFFLAGIVWLVFGQTLQYEFVNYDDDHYVYKNPEVVQGLTFHGIAWAFTHAHSFNWHPLTWISHMLDCQFYGLNASGHHLTNVLLHTVAVILLFLILGQLTGSLWRSAFVAAVFAIHPLRVESVAWVAERKDVLSGVFFMLTIWAYMDYARHSRSYMRYGLVAFLFALGLMCKPMLVSLPFVLLLLDYWPLERMGKITTTSPAKHWRRFSFPIPRQLIFEKLPLLGLAAASCVITIFAQAKAIEPFETVSMSLRIENALISYVSYLIQMFWPVRLAVFYPLTVENVTISKVVASLILLVVISISAFALRSRRPYFLVGWLWYLIMLVPVIGILQVTLQARADRYTYLPQIGIYLLLTWMMANLCAGWRHRRLILGGLSTIILIALIFCARYQVSFWRNGESLWTRALICTSDNMIAHNNLGDIFFEKNRVVEAIIHYQKAIQIAPDYSGAYYNLGNALISKGEIDEAIGCYQKTVQFDPNHSEAFNNLGYAYLQKGKPDEAVGYFREAQRLDPQNAQTCYSLGNVLLRKGSIDEAMIYLQRSLQINPENAQACCNLGEVFLLKGNVSQAIVYFQKSLQMKPDYVEALNNLALLLATASQEFLRNGNQAVELAQQANQLGGGQNPVILHTLAAAYAEVGRFGDAIESAQKAVELARAGGQTNLMQQISGELKLYGAGLPFHQESKRAKD